jgi:hypothetical protein
MLRWRACAFQPEKQRAAVAVLSFYVNKGLKAVFLPVIVFSVGNNC